MVVQGIRGLCECNEYPTVKMYRICFRCNTSRVFV